MATRLVEGDRLHLAAVAKLTPDERLARGFAWIEFANRMRGIALRQESGWTRATRSADAATSSPRR